METSPLENSIENLVHLHMTQPGIIGQAKQPATTDQSTSVRSRMHVLLTHSASTSI